MHRRAVRVIYGLGLRGKRFSALVPMDARWGVLPPSLSSPFRQMEVIIIMIIINCTDLFLARFCIGINENASFCSVTDRWTAGVGVPSRSAVSCVWHYFAGSVALFCSEAFDACGPICRGRGGFSLSSARSDIFVREMFDVPYSSRGVNIMYFSNTENNFGAFGKYYLDCITNNKAF